LTKNKIAWFSATAGHKPGFRNTPAYSGIQNATDGLKEIAHAREIRAWQSKDCRFSPITTITAGV
jgi:hypothetical protein